MQLLIDKMVAVSLRFRTVYVKDFDKVLNCLSFRREISISVAQVDKEQSLVTSCLLAWKHASYLATIMPRNRVLLNVSLSEFANTRGISLYVMDLLYPHLEVRRSQDKTKFILLELHPTVPYDSRQSRPTDQTD